MIGVIVSLPRSGSTLVSEVLNQHPQIKSFGEVFHHEAETRKWFHESGKAVGKPFDGYFHNGIQADSYIDQLQETTAKEGKTVTVFKLIDYQCPRVWREIEERRIHIIHLHRNPLECLLSSKIAEKTGVWHARNEEHLKAGRVSESIELPWYEVEDYFFRDKHLSFRTNLLRRLHFNIAGASIDYDYLCKNAPSAMKAITTMFGVEPHEFTPTQAKLALSSPLPQRISNYHELFDRFHDTQFSHWFPYLHG